MIEQESTPEDLQGPPLSEGESYTPRPARPFAPRGEPDTRAAYKRDWYLANRQRILSDLHAESAESPKKQRTAEWKAKSHKRRSAAAKRHWKTMPTSKRHNLLKNLDAGREKQAAKFAEKRPAWKVIKGRLEGASLIELAERNGTSRVPIRLVVRSVNLPEGKRYRCDRGRPFTRGSGTGLQKSLGFTKDEFAAESGIRNRRIVIWLTAPTKNLDPAEVLTCVELRSREAKRFLDEKSVEGIPRVDRYERAAVLRTLFPRLKAEYKLLLDTIPAVRGFLKQNASDCQEEELANFVIEQAQAEKRGEVPGEDFQTLLCWLPQLMSWLLANQSELKGSELSRLLVLDLLKSTCSCSDLSRRIMQDAVSDAVPFELRRLRDVRRLLSVGSTTGVELPKPVRGASRKPRKSQAFREEVLNTLPRFTSAYEVDRKSKRESLNIDFRMARLHKEGFSPREINAVLESRTPRSAAIHCAATRNKIQLKTAQNLFSISKFPK
jgi:hypothetical protein